MSMNLRTRDGWVRLTGLVLLGLCALSAACSRPADREARFLRRGKAAVESKDYARAAIEFKNAINAMPKDAEPYYQLARVYIATKDSRSAVAFLRKATELNPGHAEAQAWLAGILTASSTRETVENAEGRARAALQTKQDNAQALDALAAAELRLGKVEDAVKHLEEAFAKAPQNIGAALNLAKFKAAQNNPAGAEEVLKKLAANSPNSPSAALLLAHFYVTSGRQAEGEAEVRRALRLDPKNPDALVLLGALQSAAGHAEQAEKTYRELSGLADRQYKTSYAVFLFQEGKRSEAVTEIERLVKQDPEDRNARSLLVSAYISQGRVVDAQKILVAALARNQRDTEALLQRADFYARAGRPKEAEQDLKSVLHYKPNSAEAHLALGRVYGTMGSALSQRQELTEAVRLDPRFLVARLELASVLNAQDPSSALSILDQAPQDQKQAASYIEARNWALIATGRGEEAAESLKHVLALARTPDLVYQDGILRLTRKDYVGARQSMEEALKAFPESTAAAEGLAVSYSAEGKMPKALEVLKEKASARPKSAPLHHLLGVWLVRAGRKGEARQAFSAATDADPNFVPSLMALASMDAQDGNADGTRRRVTSVIARNPGNVDARLLLAETEEKAGNQAAAIEQYKAVAERDPKNLMALNNLAYALTREHPDEALKYAQNAIEVAPDEPSAQDTLGWIYYHKGVYRQAVDYLKKAVDKQSTPARQFHLGMAYAKIGELGLARRYVALALQQDPNLAVTEGVTDSSILGR